MKQAPWARFVIATSAVLAMVIALAIQVLAAPDGWLAVDGLIRFNPATGASYDWANSGLAGPTGTCPAGAVDIGGTGGLFNCGRPGAAGAPPTAPTLTPSAASDPTIISAVFVADPIAGDTTACGAGDPTTLNGGKNGDAVSSYGFSTGPVPAKDDLSNVYAVSHTKANGHPEIYFGAERLVNNGDSHMDFEFLQSSVGLTGICSGSFTGHRTQGDLLVAVDFTGGGSLAGDSVYLWHCAADPGPQPSDGTICDPSGGPEHYQLIAAPTFTSFTVNPANIPCGGWVCRDQIAGNSTTISTNDFLEGGVDLGGIPFAGCFNTFLPHTRTAQSFTSVLKDFAGPINFHSCRDPVLTTSSAPSGGNVAPGFSVADAVAAGNGGAGPVPTGSITFFLCGPSQVTAAGCPSGGVQVGAAKPLAGGAATSDPSSATTSAGTYCWRSEYAPDAAAIGVFAPATHTNATTECFGVVAATLPNTGWPELAARPVLPTLPLLLTPLVLPVLAWRRTRALTVILIAGLIAGSSPSPAPVSSFISGISQLQASPGHIEASPSPTSAPLLSTEKAMQAAWRLVIPRLGVDAQIEALGRDQDGAMASPSALDMVGWFNRGPVPGQPGDAVIDGHFGLPAEPAVFRDLRLLRPGDAIQVVWPDGRLADFRVALSETMAPSTQPSGLFARSGPARLSLITCAGKWEQSVRSYSDRLIVTATAV